MQIQPFGHIAVFDTLRLGAVLRHRNSPPQASVRARPTWAAPCSHPKDDSYRGAASPKLSLIELAALLASLDRRSRPFAENVQPSVAVDTGSIQAALRH